MGLVYRALYRPTQQVVALKLLRPEGLLSEEKVSRFQREARAMASLDHPHILPVYEVGRHHGQHYFSMKLVEQGSLDAQIRAGRWRLRSDGPRAWQHRLATLLEGVAQAVHHAHERGILHRDLKPANILVDGQDHPYVADFGLAKFLFEQDAAPTRSQVFMGTLPYASPEQLQGRNTDLTMASDVWGLGVILYELLTGALPFPGETTVAILDQVQRSEPIRPRSVQRAVDRDLETICLRCLEKEPHRRYASAGEVAEELRRYRQGAPLAARPVSPIERLWKWTRRQPVLAGGIGATALALLLGLAGTSWQWQRAETNLARERLAKQREQMLRAEDLAERDEPLGALAILVDALDRDPLHAVAAARALALLDGRDWLVPVGTASNVLAITPSGQWLQRAAARPATLVAAGSGAHVVWWTEGELEVWDAGNADTPPTRLPLGQVDPMVLAIAPSGREVAIADTVGEVYVLDLDATGAGNALPSPRRDRVRALSFSADGKLLAAGGTDTGLVVWAVDERRVVFDQSAHASPIAAAAFDGRGRLVSASEDGWILLRDTVRWRELRRWKHWAQITHAAFSGDGRHLLVCGSDGRAALWDAGDLPLSTSTQPQAVTAALGGPLLSGVFHPGDGLLSVRDFSGRAWRLAWCRASTPGDWGLPAEEVRVIGNGDTVVFRAEHRLGVFAMAQPGKPVQWSTNSVPFTALAVAERDRLVAAADEQGRVRVLEGSEEWRERTNWLAGPTRIESLRLVKADADWQVLVRSDQALERRSLKDGSLLAGIHLPPEELFLDDDASTNGARVLTLRNSGAVHLWHPFAPDQGQRLVMEMAESETRPGKIALSACGRWAFVAAGTSVVVQDLTRHSQPSVLDTGRLVTRLAISPDGRRLAAAGGDAVYVFDRKQHRGEPVRFVAPSPVLALHFDPEGLRLAVTSADSRMRVVDPVSGLQISQAVPVGTASAPSSVPFLSSPPRVLLPSGSTWSAPLPRADLVPGVVALGRLVLGETGASAAATGFPVEGTLAALAHRLVPSVAGGQQAPVVGLP